MKSQDEVFPPEAVFSSMDFGKFLSGLPKAIETGNSFLSKENSMGSLDFSLFKSKESFSKLFSSADWKLKLSEGQQDPKPSSGGAERSRRLSSPRRESYKSLLSSKEWVTGNTLGNHVDVSYHRDMFGTTSDSDKSIKSFASTESFPGKTNWENFFYSQLQLVPPPLEATGDSEPELTEAVDAVPLEILSSTPDEITIPLPPPIVVAATAEPASQPQSKKKRKRKPRKKIVPEAKTYVEPKDTDVLLGRGGRSNHHPGNKRYRDEVQNLQTWYNGIEDKDEKTDLSQCLVDYVHSYEGRFLEKDIEGWYIVPNIVARRKASQALREDNDPEKRAAKRRRYLKRKAERETRQQQAVVSV